MEDLKADNQRLINLLKVAAEQNADLQDRYNAQEKAMQDMRNYILEAESKAHEYEYSNTRIITKIKYMTQQALTQLTAKEA